MIVAISRDSLSSQVQVLCQDMDKFLVALFVILALSPAVWAKTTYLQITCEQDLSKLARLEDCEKAIAHLYSHPITQECGAWQADHETTMHIDATCRLKIFADPHWTKECFAVARYLAEVMYTCTRTDPVTHERCTGGAWNSDNISFRIEDSNQPEFHVSPESAAELLDD